jgi:DNA-binding SARP family transcriptional activator/tetratricopeptide (TPR) repeat protein
MVGVEFRVLGDFEVRIAGHPVDIGHARQRCVLLALLVDANQVVTVDQLVDRVWADRLPQRVRGAVYNYVSRIRRILATADDVAITRRSGGYLLAVDALAVDLHLFDHLTAQARVADDHEATALFARALSLGRGEVFATLDTPWLNAVRDTVNNRRIAAELDRNDIELRCGRHHDILPELSARAAALPLDERLAGQLMRALYRCGRQADALDHYQRTRSRLAEDLGIDPGPTLRTLHQQILTADSTLDGPTVRFHAPARQHTATPPRQLPAPPRSFTGRNPELAQLDALLPAVDAHPAEIQVVVVSGTAGIGKSTLAVHWAHQVADRFPDGQLYVNLRGFHPGGQVLDPGTALRGFLDALGVSAERIPPDPDAQLGLYRSLLAGKRILMLLDNTRDAEQVRPLLPATPGCCAVVTSRNQLTSLTALDAARPVTLSTLSTTDAYELLAHRLGVRRLVDAPAAAQAIITQCAGLPLALAITAARAAAHPTFPLATLAAKLRDSATALDVMHDDDPAADIRAVFSWSYHALSPPAARLFRLLGLHPGPDISPPAAASLAAISTNQADQLLTELAQANLAIEHTPGRYTSHDLLRTYAAEQATTHDSEPDRQAARHRLLDHYLHTAHQARMLLNPHRQPITPTPPQPETTPERIASQDHAFAWLATEYPVLRATVEQATASGYDSHAWQLAWAMRTFANRHGLWPEQIAADHTALAAAHRLGDTFAQARTSYGLATSYFKPRRLHDAGTHFQQALDLYTQLGDLPGQADAHGGLGMVATAQNRRADALTHAEQSVNLIRTTDDRDGLARMLNDLGWTHARLGNYQHALTYCGQALAVHQGLGNRPAEAATWDSLGYAHRRLTNYEQAVTSYQHAIDLYQNAGDRFNEADSLIGLGDTHEAAGNTDAAHTTRQHALNILDELDHPHAERVRARLRA